MMKWFHTLRACALFTLLTALATDMQAVPAYPRPIKVKQADGTTLTIRIYGDERFHYATTSDGYNIVPDSNGNYYYARMQGGTLVSTGIRAKDAAQRTATDRAALNSVATGVPFAALSAAQAQASAAQTAFGASFNPLEETGDSRLRQLRAEQNSGEEFHSLVILVQFADAPFTVTNPQQAFDRLLNEEGYAENNATGSARDYYKENSNGRFNPHFDVVGPFTLSGNQNSYDGHEARFIIESCNLAADNGVDFSPYVDNGVLRDVFIFFAGYNQAEAGGSYLWPARMFYTDPNIDFGTWGGGRLLAAAYTSELKGSSGATMTGIGTFCHEFGHILGWPDFYDSDYNQNGTGFNLDIFSLMAAGSYVNGGKTPPAINAFERYMVGWATPEEITETGSYTLEPVYGDHSYRINTLNEGEYFILEFRNGNINRWDAFLQNGNTGSGIGHQAIGSGSGMLIYHVDQSNNRVGSYRAKDLWALNANKVNSFGDHECMRIFMASPVSRSNGVLRDFGKMFFPGDDNIRELTASQSPYFVGWDGFSTGFELYNITQNGTANVTFDVEKLKQGQIRDLVIDPGQSDIFISFFTPFNDTYTVSCTAEGEEPLTVSTKERTIHFTELKPGTKYTISLTYEDNPEPFEVREVTTEVVDPTKLPTLAVKASYTTDDTIVLRYRNVSTDVTSVRWYLDDARIGGTFIKNPTAGINRRLTAEIITADGTEYFTKYINITE